MLHAAKLPQTFHVLAADAVLEDAACIMTRTTGVWQTVADSAEAADACASAPRESAARYHAGHARAAHACRKRLN